MLHYDYEQSLGYWLINAAQAYERTLNAELAPKGVTFRQCQVLGNLAMEGELSQTELAERLHVEPPTLVGILDRMQRDGWITRQDCPQDRRKKMIQAQPQAEPIWDSIMETARSIRARASDGLSPDQVQTLIQMLRMVLSNMSGEKPPKESH